MATSAKSPATPSPRPVRRRGRAVFWVFVATWVLAVVALYIVIVRLKLGGEAGIRLPEPAAAEDASGSPPTGAR